MKKTIAVILSAIMVLGLAGCVKDSEETKKSVESKTTSSIIEDTEDNKNKLPATENSTSDKVKPDTTEETKEKTTEKETEKVQQSPSDNADAASLDGIWHTVSFGENGPKYYVQFGDMEIKYGNLEDDKFVEDHADKISRLEKNGDNGFLIQAQREDGSQYTFRTSADDKDTLEYYGTWKEEEFDSSYSGGSSLMRSMT